MPALADRIVAGSWTLTVLPNPKRLTRSRALGFWGGDPFGTAEGTRPRAQPMLWLASGPREIAPKGFEKLGISVGSGELLMGSCAVKGADHAILLARRGDVFEVTDLHDKTFERSYGVRVADGQQVGHATRKGSNRSLAILWSGSAQSAVELPGLDPERSSQALAVGGGMQGGVSGSAAGHHAALWRGSSEPAVDLHPGKGFTSSCDGIADGEQVGVLWLNMDVSRPALWRGSADTFVDLTPKAFHGGNATACARGLQVGSVTVDEKGTIRHAVLWAGSAEDFLDLHELVPAKDFNASYAHAISVEETCVRIAGQVELKKDDALLAQRAAVWQAELRAAKP